jgi:hypothetical protein
VGSGAAEESLEFSTSTLATTLHRRTTPPQEQSNYTIRCCSAFSIVNCLDLEPTDSKLA